MTPLRFTILLTLAAAFAGCYHATVTTGLTPSTTVINESFASSWVYGLVPPNTIATESKCPDGVAIVETQLSFVNQLVGFLTLGIYTPMEIKVTCAAKSMSSLRGATPDFFLPEGSSVEEAKEVFMRAADLAVSTGKPVYVGY